MNCDEFGREIPGGINGNVGSSFDDTTNMNMLRSKGRDDDDSPKDPGATAGSTGINANGATNHTRGNHYNKRSYSRSRSRTRSRSRSPSGRERIARGRITSNRSRSYSPPQRHRHHGNSTSNSHGNGNRDRHSYSSHRRSRTGRSNRSISRSRSHSPSPRGIKYHNNSSHGQDRYRSKSDKTNHYHEYDHRDHRRRDRDSTISHSQSHKHLSRSSYKYRKQHPSFSYIDEPILSQFLYEKEMEQEGDTQGHDHDNVADADAGNITAPDPNAESSSNEVTDKDNTLTPAMGHDPNANNAKDPEELKRQYQAYNQESCLKYVRSFFNQHLDDTWFRERYSPLEYKRKVQSHKERAACEAMAVLNEVRSSLDDLSSKRKAKENDKETGPGPTTSLLSTSNSLEVPSFIINARLGNGVKPANDSREAHSHSAKKRKYSSTNETPHYDLISSYGLPKSHLFSFLQDDTALHIMDIPSHVNEEHLMLAIKEHVKTDVDLLPTNIICGEVVHGVCDAVKKSMERKDEFDMNVDVAGGDADNDRNGNNGKNTSVRPKFNGSYQRSAWAIFPNAAAKEKFLVTIIGSNMDSDRDRHARASRSIPKVIELSVDCSDPYGRYDIDADGKGGEPASVDMKVADGTDVNGIATANANFDTNGSNGGDSARIPIRRVSVFVSTTSPLKSQSTTVLSAAVSSLSRVPADKNTAIKIAKVLDTMKDIPVEAHLDNILDTLYSFSGCSTKSNEITTCEDMLDVTIAYLRRVHLFTFYNGCTAAENVGSCLTIGDPTSVIHQRLRGADDILQKAREENADMYDDLPMHEKDTLDSTDKREGLDRDRHANLNEPKDMLVMRLDDSIEKALVDLPPDLSSASPFVVNESIDAVASEIESLEEKTKREWLSNHTAVDGDGRARCSFHFCRKLFKDETFLQKHLLKKHGEHLHAELAKCHDVYMMNWWDNDVCRPVPSILVDCGSKFGHVPEPVIGAVKPYVSDPEPKLWREEEERICKEKEEDQRYREHKISSVEASNKNEDYKRDEDPGTGNEGNFVDVDDMKDDKVELSFSNTENIQPLKKKKRKKRKLL